MNEEVVWNVLVRQGRRSVTSNVRAEVYHNLKDAIEDSDDGYVSEEEIPNAEVDPP